MLCNITRPVLMLHYLYNLPTEFWLI